MTISGRNRRLGLSVLLALSALLLLASAASATQYQRPLKEVFGPTEQPAFHAPEVIAADRETGDVLVDDRGGNANQIVSFSGFAEGDLFTLANLPAACGGAGAEIEYSISTGTALRDNVGAKLEEKCGAGNTSVSGSAAEGIKIQFIGAFEAESMPLISCAVVPGHGSGACSVEVSSFGAAPGIYRFHADGTPAPFAAIGTNRLDGEGSGTCAYPPTPSQACDKTPPDELDVGAYVQIAIDESGGPTDGNIYVTQNKNRQGPSRPAYHVVDIFSKEGKYLGQVTSGVAGNLTSAQGVAVDAEGTLYVTGNWKLGPEVAEGVGKCHPSGAFPVDHDCTEFLPLPEDLGEGRKYETFGQLALGAGPSAGSVFITATIRPPGSGQVPGLAKMDLATGETDLFAVGYGGAGYQGAIAVNPANGNPVARSGGDATELVEFDGSGETAGEPVSRLRAEGSGAIEGVAFDRAGDLDLAPNSGGPVRTYGAPTIVPTVVAGEATEVTTNSATLNGTVNPSGLAVSACRLEALPESEAGHQTDELQRVTFSGATGGTFTLGFQGQTTTALADGVNAVKVQAALAALPAIGAGNVSVRQTEDNYYITFTGALAATDVPQVVVDASGLTPAGATAEVVTTRQGGGWGNAKVAACEGAVPTDEEDHAVHGSVTGLKPNAVEYVFRLVATNANGTETSYGSFLTAHTARTDPAEVTGSHTATLKATIRPEGQQYTECIFEYGLATNLAGYEHTALCDPAAAAIPPDSLPHTVEAEIEGLNEATAYRFRIKAANAAEGVITGEEETFETFGPPRLLALRASDATRDAATLEAEINPSGFDTSYQFEWGPTDSYGHAVPASMKSIGAGTDRVRVTAPISGLATAGAYHYRVVVQSSAGSVSGVDHTLETLNSCGLPEGRCLEMVSRRDPGPYAQPGEFFAYPEIHFQASEEPGKLAYVAELGYPDATRGAEILYLGQRGAEGWASGQLAPPVTAPDEFHNVSSVPSVFLGLSPDLSCGVLTSTQPLTSNPAAQLTLEAGGANLYRRNADGTYTLLTDLPPQPLEELGGVLTTIFQLVGLSADCSKIVFKTGYHFAGLPGVGSSRLYEWSEAGGLRYAGFVPAVGGGEEAVEASASGYKALSEDGSRLFFSAKRLVGKVPGEVGETGVFVREGGTSTDVSASATSTPDEGAKFEGATPDGSRVYFTANSGLTAESSPEGTDLYEYDLEDEELTDISVGDEAGGAQVGGEGQQHNSGALVGVAADGSHVYYIVQGQLVRGQGRTLAANRAAGTYSLYDYDSATGAVRFVATVTRDDVESVTFATITSIKSRVGPEGRYLLFESRADVTGYDSGGAPQAYLYDAEAPVARPVVCVSCRQDGAASVGSERSLPPLRAGANSFYQPLSLVVRDGRPLVFFSSEDDLAPGAVAGTSNLYEWAGGQVFLVAAEGKGENFGFIGAAADATDLYFYAWTALNWEDPEARPAAWDARIGGGFPQPPAPPSPCDAASEGSCPSGPVRAPASPPSAASRSFEGPGNVKPRAKHHKKKHHKKRHAHHKRKHKQHKKKHKTKSKHKKAKRQRGQAK